MAIKGEHWTFGDMGSCCDESEIYRFFVAFGRDVISIKLVRFPSEETIPPNVVRRIERLEGIYRDIHKFYSHGPKAPLDNQDAWSQWRAELGHPFCAAFDSINAAPDRMARQNRELENTARLRASIRRPFAFGPSVDLVRSLVEAVFYFTSGNIPGIKNPRACAIPNSGVARVFPLSDVLQESLEFPMQNYHPPPPPRGGGLCVAAGLLHQIY